MVLDATCGNGSVAKILRATRRGDRTVVTNDIDPAHEADYHLDAAQPQLYDTLAAIYDAVDWVVFNPPHEQPICLQVINMAIERARYGVCALLRMNFREPLKEDPRGEWLERHPMQRRCSLSRRRETDSRHGSGLASERVCQGSDLSPFQRPK